MLQNFYTNTVVFLDDLKEYKLPGDAHNTNVNNIPIPKEKAVNFM